MERLAAGRRTFSLAAILKTVNDSPYPGPSVYTVTDITGRASLSTLRLMLSACRSTKYAKT